MEINRAKFLLLSALTIIPVISYGCTLDTEDETAAYFEGCILMGISCTIIMTN